MLNWVRTTDKLRAKVGFMGVARPLTSQSLVSVGALTGAREGAPRKQRVSWGMGPGGPQGTQKAPAETGWCDQSKTKGFSKH